MVVILVALYLNAGFIGDDSFILYHYAQNIAAGKGPYFNPGESVDEATMVELSATTSGRCVPACSGPGAFAHAARAAARVNSALVRSGRVTDSAWSSR